MSASLDQGGEFETMRRQILSGLPRALVVTALCCAALHTTAGTVQPSGCEDLGAIAETPAVDFETQIQPILTANCNSCHGAAALADLDLRPGAAYDNLVGVTSTTNPDRLRVAPGAPDASTLLLAINCSSPGGPGFQMTGTTLEQRALIRDWILQGALPEPRPALPVPVDAGWALLALIVLMLVIVASRLGAGRRLD